MKKCLKLVAMLLALGCLMGALAGCGEDPGAATKAEADKIVDEINAFFTESKKFEIRETFKHKDNVVENGFIYNNYMIEYTDELANINLELIYTEDTHEFAGIKVNTKVYNTEDEQAKLVFSAVSVALISINELGLKDTIDFDTYLNLKEGDKVSIYQYTAPYEGVGDGFIIAKYYDELKFKN